MSKDADKNDNQPCRHCGEIHAAGQSSCAKVEKQQVKIGAYTAQLCSFCGQKHRGGREVCQGTDDEETPVLPGRKHRSITGDTPSANPGSSKDEDTPLTPGRRPRSRKHKHKQVRDESEDSVDEAEASSSRASSQGAQSSAPENPNDTSTGESDGTTYGDTVDDGAISFDPGEQPRGSALPQAKFNRSSQRQRAPRLSVGDEGPLDDGEIASTVRAQLSSVNDDRYAEDLVGHTLGSRFALLELIGKGGMSAVYKAKDIKLNKFLAVKVLLPHLMANPVSMQRFQVEAQAASSLSHPNLIVTHDFGVTLDGRPYLVMELLDGESLGDLLKREKRLPLERAVPIFIQICDALSHAHAKGVLHRDLKPSNVMISPAGSGIDFVRLLDFGIAKVLPREGAESRGLTQTGEVFGSPNYMSPEQCSGSKLDQRGDIYSMGCLMYEVLSGVPPLVGDNIMETLLKQINEPPPDFRSIDPELNVPQQIQLIIFKALAKNPNERYASAEALGEALRAFQQNVTVLLLKHIQDRWQVIKLKIRPLKKREKTILVFTAIITVMFLTVAWKQLSSYYEMTTQTNFPPDQAFMPIPVPRPTAPPIEQSVLLKSLELQGEMLKADPNSERYDQYRSSLESIAQGYVSHDFFKEAALCYESLLQLGLKHDGKTALGTRDAMERLADCDFKQGKYKEAAKYYNILQENLGGKYEQNPNRQSELKMKEATSLYALGKYSEALPVFQRVVRQLELSEHSKDGDYAITSARMAECYRLRRLWSESITQYENAADAYKQFLHDGGYFTNNNVHETRATLVNFYRAYCSYKLDKLETAAKGYKSVIPHLKKLSGPGRDLAVPAMMQYSDILWRQGKYVEALQTRMKAKELLSLFSE